ncbi:MAG: hypothetical protein IPK82_35700 [Polyangiaceae bacterium]|nr:hypothetical protein [Polyangiaceae bacterium]
MRASLLSCSGFGLFVPILMGCAGSPPDAGTVVIPVTAAKVPEPTLSPDPGGVDPPSRSGTATRVIDMAPIGPSAHVYLSLDVPASWAVRSTANFKSLRPCQLSPSSPSELFIGLRLCTTPSCAEHEKLGVDLGTEALIDSTAIEHTESLRVGSGQITRLTGHRGNHTFSAFRFVVPVSDSTVASCEAFLFGDDRAFQTAYESACFSVQILPDASRTGTSDLPAAPDSVPPPAPLANAAQTAADYATALWQRDETKARAYLLTSVDCVHQGGAADTCSYGEAERTAALTEALTSFPSDFIPGSADARYALDLPGVLVATVKRRGDPCGPGYEIILTQTASGYAVLSPDPTPDPRLAK